MLPCMATVRVRAALESDLPAIDRIYDHYVHNSTCTAQLAPAGLEARRRWFEEHDATHPVVVAELAGTVVGWGSLSVYNRREGYAATVEDSVYVDDAHRGRGIGSAVLSDMIERARSLGYRTMIAGISGDQQPSMALHARHGFVHAGRLREVVRKFGQWLDVLYMQRTL